MRTRRFATVLVATVMPLVIATNVSATPAVPATAALGDFSAQGMLPQVPRDRFVAALDIEPRLQWNANFGYCGETSYISAGMYFGQYASQWTVRGLASPGIPQTDEESQLLIGVNDLVAAERMRLEAVAFDSESQESVPEYLTWIKSMTLRGYPVIMGVLKKLDESDSTYPGSAEYDHIVPVLGVASQARLRAGDRRYRPTDALLISDNSGANANSRYRLGFRDSLRTRAEANRAGAPDYSLRNRPMNYATAVIGVRDPDHVTIPVRLVASLDGEGEQDGEMLKSPPTPQPLEITARVLLPDPDQAYRVYLYDDFAKVPIRDFNAAAGQAIQSWTIPPGSGSAWSTTISLTSDQTRVFRAVPATAP